MIFKDGKPSEFYKSYVKNIQAKITENAALEFGCIQKEHDRQGGVKPRTLVSDELSSTLNDLQAELESSDLFDDVASRRNVLGRAIPDTLVNQVGLDTLMTRLPEAYQRALFSSWVAAHYIYEYGTQATPVDSITLFGSWRSRRAPSATERTGDFLFFLFQRCFPVAFPNCVIIERNLSCLG